MSGSTMHENPLRRIFGLDSIGSKEYTGKLACILDNVRDVKSIASIARTHILRDDLNHVKMSELCRSIYNIVVKYLLHGELPQANEFNLEQAILRNNVLVPIGMSMFKGHIYTYNIVGETGSKYHKVEVDAAQINPYMLACLSPDADGDLFFLGNVKPYYKPSSILGNAKVQVGDRNSAVHGHGQKLQIPSNLGNG